MPQNTTAWPKGVIARYLTVGGATVDLTNRGPDYLHVATCVGCDARWTHDGDWGARSWAQSHAEECRAMPRPA